MKRIITVCLLGCLCAHVATAELRNWRTTTGQSFEGEFVRVEGDSAIFSVKGKEYRYQLSLLTVQDRLLIGRIAYQQRSGTAAPATSTPPMPGAATPSPPPGPVAASSLQFMKQPLPRGEPAEFTVAVSDAAQLKELRDAYKKPSQNVKLLLATPAEFSPATRAHPILIVSSTTDGDGSSIGSARANFLPTATGKGYLVMAVDGEFGKPEGGDSTDFRWALVSAGLGAIYRDWPQAKSWPIATGGISGGGGYASHQGIKLVDAQRPLIGIFLSVTGWNPTDFADVLRKAPRTPMRNVPIFISAGEKDTVATPEITGKARKELQQENFRQVRYETFPGGHELHRPHLEAALDWFLGARTAR